MKQIIIIVGSSTIFFYTSNLDEKRYTITILEQNADILQKVRISGSIRCNVAYT